ncbi:hypothetical protein Taro_051347 [Colocasia esculenta]|uniref:Uncharacterized protein n=1 Tax=Colocasia esculenta TaxID=4460 RepID=A0A843XGB1_COLES|nr:hypothetical protein [Colocasia esculenta]
MECRGPFGENVNGLVGEISRLISIYASFDVSYWRNVPEDRKSKIYEKIWDKFELKVGDEICNNAHVREIIYEIACQRYRDIRRTYYSHYQAYETDEARLQNPPNNAMSERNKANRSKQLISHVTGRKSFKQTSWTERNEEGEEPPAHELWRLTHQKKDGSWGSEYSRQVYETIRDKLEESSSQSCSLAAPTPEEVLTSVVG